MTEINRDSLELDKNALTFYQTRKKYCMTQEKWAEVLGLGISTVKNIERGKIPCSDRSLWHMEQYVTQHPLPEDNVSSQNPFTPEQTDLETRILYDLIASRIRYLSKPSTQKLAGSITAEFNSIKQKKPEFKNSDSESDYYEIVLKAIKIFSRTDALATHKSSFYSSLFDIVSGCQKIDTYNPVMFTLLTEFIHNLACDINSSGIEEFWHPLINAYLDLYEEQYKREMKRKSTDIYEIMYQYAKKRRPKPNQTKKSTEDNHLEDTYVDIDDILPF